MTRENVSMADSADTFRAIARHSPHRRGAPRRRDIARPLARALAPRVAHTLAPPGGRTLAPNTNRRPPRGSRRLRAAKRRVYFPADTTAISAPFDRLKL